MINKMFTKIKSKLKNNKTLIIKNSKSKKVVSSRKNILSSKAKRASFITPEFEDVLRKNKALSRALLDVILSSKEKIIKTNNFKIISVNNYKLSNSLNTSKAYVLEVGSGSNVKKYYLKIYNSKSIKINSLDSLQLFMSPRNAFVEAYLLSELEKLGYSVVKPQFAKVKFTKKYSYNFIISEFKNLMPLDLAVKKGLLSEEILNKVRLDTIYLMKTIPKKMKLSVEDLEIKNIFVDLSNGDYKLFVLDLYSINSFKSILKHLNKN